MDSNEAWPSFEGRLMAGLAQLNVAESPITPPELAGLAFIAVWIAADDEGYLVVPDGRKNGDGWAVRSYDTLDGLVEIQGRVLPGIRPRQLDWEVADDYPGWEDLVDAVEFDRLEGLLAGRNSAEAVGATRSGTKLGGWPTLIQSEIFWAPNNQHPATPTYCFQIGTEESVGLNLWDAGVLHIGLGQDNGHPVWVAESQCY